MDAIALLVPFDQTCSAGFGTISAVGGDIIHAIFGIWQKAVVARCAPNDPPSPTPGLISALPTSGASDQLVTPSSKSPFETVPKGGQAVVSSTAIETCSIVNDGPSSSK